MDGDDIATISLKSCMRSDREKKPEAPKGMWSHAQHWHAVVALILLWRAEAAQTTQVSTWRSIQNPDRLLRSLALVHRERSPDSSIENVFTEPGRIV